MALDTVINSCSSNSERVKANMFKDVGPIEIIEDTPVPNGHDQISNGHSHDDGVLEANGVRSIDPIKAAKGAPLLNGPDSGKIIQKTNTPIVEDGFTARAPSNDIDSLKVPEAAADGVQHAQERLPLVETDLLIVGTGPAGASLACFLTTYGLKGIMIGATPGCATTPRAHITNMAALECLRDLGLEDECIKQAAPNEGMLHTRWVRSMAGDEIARAYSWGNDPARKVY